MIQNANDNKFEEAEPTLVISYTGRHIQIECNEVGFTAENVDAICSIARSSKKRPGDTTSYVGEKGIGFKSVFRVADVVWVSSRAYSFKFDSRSRLGMITPILDQFPVATRPGWTSFYLQLRENDESAKMQAAIRFDLATFDARMLLFLRNLQTIHIVLDQGGQQLVEESSSRMYRRYDGKWNGFCMRNLTQGDETKRYVLQKHTLELENLAINEPRRDGATSTEVALAFPIQGDEPVVAPQQVFAFLPINDFGFSVRHAGRQKSPHLIEQATSLTLRPPPLGHSPGRFPFNGEQRRRREGQSLEPSAQKRARPGISNCRDTLSEYPPRLHVDPLRARAIPLGRLL